MMREERWPSVREFHSWGQPLVMDLSFLKDMNMKQSKSMARELTYACRYVFFFYFLDFTQKFSPILYVKGKLRKKNLCHFRIINCVTLAGTTLKLSRSLTSYCFPCVFPFFEAF